MLGISPESFILLRVTVVVCGGGEVLAVNAELVSDRSWGLRRVGMFWESRLYQWQSTIFGTEADQSETSFVRPTPAPDLSTEQSIAVTSEVSRKSVTSQFREGGVCGMQNTRRQRADPLTTAENAPVSGLPPCGKKLSGRILLEYAGAWCV